MPVPQLEKAVRCQHIKLDGEPCRCPAIRGHLYCHFHDGLSRTRGIAALPLVEDATSLHFALIQIVRALFDHSIDPKTCSLVLWTLQIACSNLKNFKFERRSSSFLRSSYDTADDSGDSAAPSTELAEAIEPASHQLPQRSVS